MPYDNTARLWSESVVSYFAELALYPLRQKGPHCVATALAILSGQSPESFQGRINTQDPVSWSQALRPFNMKLAYCPTDIRRVEFYLRELVSLDDLFLVSFYTGTERLLSDPDARGWLRGSHIVVLHRNQILDPATGTVDPAEDSDIGLFHTKRIFRVVPQDHARGL